MTQSKFVVLTGASTGIGYSTLALLISKGFQVFGSVRKQEDADRLSKAFGDNFTPLIFDITNQKAIDEQVAIVKETVGERGLAALINNAGVAVSGPLVNLEVEQFRYQFEVNFFGLIHLTQSLLPLLGATQNFQSSPGKVINVSSTSGRLAMPFVGPYAASKHALEGYSDILRREMKAYGVGVVVIEPGPVKTPIWNKIPKDLSIFDNTPYKVMVEKRLQGVEKMAANALPPEKIARRIYKSIISKSPKARYVLTGNALFTWYIPRLMPDKWLDFAIGKVLGVKNINRGK